MYRVIVRYGVESTEASFSAPPTAGAIKKDYNTRAELGYGDNVRLLVNGVEQPDAALISPGTTVTIETKANEKAVELVA